MVQEWKQISSVSLRKSLKNVGKEHVWLCGVPVKRISMNTYEIDGEFAPFTLDEAVEYLYDIQPIKEVK